MKHLLIVREGIKEVLKTYLYLKYNFSNEVNDFRPFVLNAVKDAQEFFNLQIDIENDLSIKKAIEVLNKF